MTTTFKKFPAKILLAGEYSIIRKSAALAIPFELYGGQFEFGRKESPSNNVLQKLSDYLENNNTSYLQLDKFRNDIEEGLSFRSEIPQGYGMGSSGALIAAIYDAYSDATDPDLDILQPRLALMESYFHGSSSGFDPLVSLLNSAVLIENSKARKVDIGDNIQSKNVIFLLDSKKERNTQALVNIFLDKCHLKSFENSVDCDLIPLVNEFISCIIKSDKLAGSLFRSISKWELEKMQEMIPGEIFDVWENGLLSEKYLIKLCGAGGGGFFLGYTSDWDHVSESLDTFHPMRILGL